MYVSMVVMNDILCMFESDHGAMVLSFFSSDSVPASSRTYSLPNKSSTCGIQVPLFLM